MEFEFGAVVAVALVAIGFAVGALTAGRFLRPNHPNAAKSSIYECGEKTIGSAWFNFNPRFYLIALVFVIFEVDIAVTFPVVAVYKEWVAYSTTMGLIALTELLIFTGILVVGLAWVWVHGDLDWVKRLAEVDDATSARPPAKRAA